MTILGRLVFVIVLYSVVIFVIQIASEHLGPVEYGLVGLGMLSLVGFVLFALEPKGSKVQFDETEV